MDKKKEGGQPGNNNAVKWTEEIVIELGKDLIEWLMPKYIQDPKNKNELTDDHAGNIFFEKFLVVEKDLYPHAITYLKDNFKSFLQYLKKAKKLQEMKLQEFAIHKNIDTTMAIFLLKHHHKFTDRSQVELRETPFDKILDKMGDEEKSIDGMMKDEDE
jgi:hypothetical protein